MGEVSYCFKFNLARFLGGREKHKNTSIKLKGRGGMREEMPKTAAKKTGEAKSKKGPSPYNQFMKTELAKLKKADPKLAHK